MIRTRIRAGLAGLTLTAALAVPTLAASAATTTITVTASDFVSPADAAGQIGVWRTLTVFDLEANGFGAFVGTACPIRVTSTNGESVHVLNEARISSNGDTIAVTGTEDGAFGVHTSDRTLVLGPTIVVENKIGGRLPGELPAGTSVDLVVVVSCSTDETTTTTTTPDTSTSTSTSTTTPDTSTSTSTSTTTPDTSTSTSTSTSTTTPDTSTSTIPPVTPPPTLPFTGPGPVAGLAFAAAALLTLGGAGVAAAREPGRHSR